MRLYYLLLPIMVWACTGKAQDAKKSDPTFNRYISTFKSVTLPLILDRETVFNLSKTIYDKEERTYIASPYYEMSEDFRVFLPTEIENKQTINNFRCLFVFPNVNNIIPAVIAKDFYQEGERCMLQLFIVLYDKGGKVLDFAEMAGYNIDISETFAEIATNFEITVKKYQFKNPPDNKLHNLFFLNECQQVYTITNSGNLIKIKENKREGYFEGNGKSYSYVEKD